MKPIKTEDCNSVFTAQGCGDLPAVITDKSIVSCWEMTEKEKEEFLKTGKIYLLVMGRQQPPVSLYVDRPYLRQ